MKLLGNIIWLIFGGLHIAIEYFMAGLVLLITIIGIPFGLQSMKLGILAIWPFGSKVKWKESQPGCLSMFMNVLWFFVGGIWICLTHIFYGLLLCITIIGIPWGKMHFRMAKLALSPFGMEVVQAMNKDEIRELRRKRLMDSKAYQAMSSLTRYMDRYYLDALIGIIPGWGDAITFFCVVPFIYFSSRVIKSIPLTLAVLNNALRDVLMGMIPFFIGDIIDFFHRANIQNMQMIQGFVDGDETIIKQVYKKAWQSAIVLIVLLLLIILLIWALVSFGSYLYSLVASIF